MGGSRPGAAAKMETIMAVRKLADGKWLIDIYENGRHGKRYRSVFYGTEYEANIAERDLKKELGAVVNSTATIAGLIEPYLDWAQKHLAEKTYIEKYRMINGPVLSYFGKYSTGQITKRVLENYKTVRLNEIGKKHR